MGGGDVEALIEKAENHQLPLHQALRIASEVCHALEHAHALGVVHRDVKPGNVWLTEDGGQRTEAGESSLSPGERVRLALSRAEGVRGTAAESIQTAKLGDFGLA